MEAKFSPTAVAIFLSTVTGALIAFFIWFFSATILMNTTEYKVVFPSSVAGLYVGSNVSYNGLSVGHVAEINLEANFGNRVVAILSVDSKVQIKQDTFATLNMKGITGQMFIELNGGSTTSPILQGKNKQIAYRESTLNLLTNAAPIIIDKISMLIDKLEKLVSGSNKKNFDELMTNINQFSKQVTLLPTELKRSLEFFNGIMKQALPMLTEGVKPIMPILTDIKEISKNLSQFTNKINNQGIMAIITSARSL